MNAAQRPPPVRAPRSLHLSLNSLGRLQIDADDVRAVRAEDASGAFTLWPGHADFITVLGAGVLSWRCGDEAVWRHCALRGGVLTVHGGREVAVAAREAVAGDDLAALRQQVRERLRQRQQQEDDSRREQRALELRVLRELLRSAHDGGGGIGSDAATFEGAR